MSEGICKINDGIGDKFGCCLQYCSSFLTGLIIGFVHGWKLTLIILTMSPLLAISGILYSKTVARMSSKEQEIYSKAGQLAEQVFSGIKTVFAYNACDYEFNLYRDQLKLTRRNGIRMGAIFGLVTGFDYLVVFCADALGFWFGAKFIRLSDYTIGQTLMVFFSVINSMFALGRSAPYFQSILSAKGNALSIWKILERKEKKRIDQSKRLKPLDINGNIDFVNVCFSYPSRPNLSILKNISFHISSGQTIAIVGATGSGKSTCIELLGRFYEPESGFICLDNQRLNEYDVEHLRNSMSVVNQQPILFETTVMENIRMGSKEATDQEIIQLCQHLGIDKTICSLSKDGYQTKIIQNGSNLSGGQRQKIALARALLKNPRILLLDEATAALDNESERQLQMAIERASKNRTTIIIAHRLSTIRNAEQILVFDQGTLIEYGNHENLMTNQGKYFQLVQTQLFDEQFLDDDKSFDDVQEEQSINSIEMKEISQENHRINYLFFKLLSLNKPEWIFILFGCLTSILNGAIEPTFAFMLSKIVSVLEECQLVEHKRYVNFYIILFVLTGFVMFITMFLQNFFFSISGEGLTYRLRLRAFRTMLEQNLSWFDRPENNVGTLCAKLANETSAVNQAIGVFLGIFLRNFSNLFIGIVLGLCANWSLTLLMCLFIPFIILSGWLQTKILSKFVRIDCLVNEKASNIVTQVTQNIRTVKQLIGEKHFLDKYEDILNESYRKLKYRCHFNGFLFGLANSISFFAQSALFYFGFYLIRKNEILFEDIILIFSLITFGVVSVSQSFAMAPDYAKARTAAKKLFRLFDLCQSKEMMKNSNERIQSLENLQFDKLTYNYQNRPDKTILKEFSLNVQSGQHVALIGASGCGKSTIFQLIERFYDYSHGNIKINSKDIREIDVNNLRSQIAFVSQEIILFNRSIAENIKYGDLTRDISDEEMFVAAQRANIHDFIVSLPDGYSTILGSHGLQLAGGQRQRIAMARAFIRRANLLLLDEPTSALDAINEQILQKALDEIQHHCTSITIAHRLSTIKHCDVIYVMDKGHIIEYGNHQQLIEQKGFYYKLLQNAQR